MKKKIIKIALIILAIMFIVIIGFYVGNTNTRLWINKYIFRRDIGEADLPKIDIDEKDNVSVYAYGSYIATVSNNTLSIYNKSGKVVSNINVSITTPKFESNGKYLLLADKEKSNVYLIYNDSLQWQKEIDGKISQITVNENGAVGIAISGTTYKTVIIMYDITGEESFRTYMSTTTGTDLSISNDNKYLSFIEVNTSGTTIESKIKTISIDKAKTVPNEAIIYTYTVNSNELLLKIKYNKNKLVGFCDTGIHLYNDGNDEEILKIENSINFADINLNGHICSIKESTDNIINSKYDLNILNVESKKTNTYIINSNVKSIYCKDNIIAVNEGNEIEFVNTNAWLLKKFTTIQNIKDITIGEHVVGIIYKNRIEILSL